MTLDDLQVLTRDQDAFKKAFRKQGPKTEVPEDRENEIVALIKGQFVEGRLPSIHQVTLPDGTQIRLKFVDTVKKIFNSKNVEQLGRESYLTYLEVSVLPVGVKGYYFTTDVVQNTWLPVKSKATVKYEVQKAKLLADAEALGIDLSKPGAWHTAYTQNY